MARKKHLINVHTSTGTTAPTGASLYLGEIAVQHTPNDPGLWIKMGTTEASTTYEKFIGKTEITNMVSASSGLVNDLSAVTLTGVTMNNSPVNVANHVANLGTVITAETQLSTATAGTGNVVGSIGVSNHKITTTMFSAASADQISKLSAGTISLVASSAASVYSSAVSYVNSAITGLDSSTAVTNGKYITGIAIADGKISGITEATLPSAPAITATTAGTGNVFTAVSTTGHSMTFTKGMAAAAKADLDSLSAATTAHTADSTSHVTSADKSKWNSAITAVTSAGTGNAFTDYSVANNKLTLTKGATYLTTAATTTQGTRADNALQIVSGSTYIEMSAKSGSAGAKMQTATIKQQGVSTATATGQGLADAYEVKQYVDGLVTSAVDYKGATATLPTTSATGDLYITTAQIVLTAAQSATGAAQTAETGDFIIARSSGKWDVIQKNLDGAITGSLTADTVTLGSGPHTVKSLANGSNGQVLALVSNKPAWTSAVKVNSATTADSATNATNATNAVSATTSQSANTAAALTGNITTGQVTNLTTKIQTTKVNSATTADSATNATNATSATTSLSANVATNAAKVNNHTVNSDVPANAVFTDTKVTAVENHYTATTATKTGGTTTATSASAIKGITYDAAGHIFGITTGSVLTSQASITTANGTTGNNAAAVITGITTGGTAGHQLTLNKSNKIFSASTSDSALTTVSAVTSWSAQTTILGPTYSYSGIPYVKSATSLADAYSALTKELIDDEKVTSAALNDLNNRVNTLCANTPTDYVTTQEFEDHELVAAAAFNDLNSRIADLSGNTNYDISNLNSQLNILSGVVGNISGGTGGGGAVTSVTINGNGNVLSSATFANSALTLTRGNAVTAVKINNATKNPSNGVVDLGTVLTAQTSVSVGVGAAGNNAAAVFTGITISGTAGHALTFGRSNKVFSATTADSARTSLSAITSLSAQTSILGPAYTYSGLPYVKSATSVADAYSALTEELFKDEKVTSAALNDLNDRVNTISANTSSVVTAEEYEEDEVVIAAALNDLNSRIVDLSGDSSYQSSLIQVLSGLVADISGNTGGGGGGGITGVTAGGTAVPVTNNMAAIPSASSSTFGVVKAGTFLTSNNGTLTVSTGTTSSTIAKGDHTHSAYATSGNVNTLSSATRSIQSSAQTAYNSRITGGTITSGSTNSITTTNNRVAITAATLPSYSTADNGKVLMIQNGVPQWVIPSTIIYSSSQPTGGNDGDIWIQTS